MWFDEEEDDDDDSIKTYKSWMISYEMFSMMCQDCCNEFWMEWNETNKCNSYEMITAIKEMLKSSPICWMPCV